MFSSKFPNERTQNSPNEFSQQMLDTLASGKVSLHPHQKPEDKEKEAPQKIRRAAQGSLPEKDQRVVRTVNTQYQTT